MMNANESVLDDRGVPCAFFERDERDGTPWADEITCAPGYSTDIAAATVVRALAGWCGTAEGAFGSTLLDAGAQRLRAFHTYTLPLPRPEPEPQLPAGLRAVPAAEVRPAALHEALLAAYPPNHPDHDDDALQALDGLYDGTLIGPMLPCSTVALDGERAVAVVLVQDYEGEPPLGGPWISEVFRQPGPAYAGMGTLLLRRVIARASTSGLTTLGLAVTETNPAQAVYERLGFTRTATWTKMAFPGNSFDPSTVEQ
ncbi:GNAT family N-acetyltransferase [Nocardia sp. NPDC058058]|uniref:GNAT family N-acetyltransferase n=1 Tax=Nocardia sp. NPDC058058 TaxID=3346317 RepID=UPI0036D8C8D2